MLISPAFFQRDTSSLPGRAFQPQVRDKGYHAPSWRRVRRYSPIYVRKGRTVMYSTYVLHRRKDIWGDDADIFNPDRWIGRKVNWEYIPFNGGPRTCIGQQFALMRASYVVVRLLQRFSRIEDVHSDKEIRYGVSLTSCPADPMTVRLQQAETED